MTLLLFKLSAVVSALPREAITPPSVTVYVVPVISVNDDRAGFTLVSSAGVLALTAAKVLFVTAPFE